jgi:hypothetical protein
LTSAVTLGSDPDGCLRGGARRRRSLPARLGWGTGHIQTEKAVDSRPATTKFVIWIQPKSPRLSAATATNSGPAITPQASRIPGFAGDTVALVAPVFDVLMSWLI